MPFPFTLGDKLLASELNSYRQNLMLKLGAESSYLRNAGETHYGQDMSSGTPAYIWLAQKPSSGEAGGQFVYIYRLERQSGGGYVYKAVRATITCTTSATLYGITETGGKVYVWYKDNTSVLLHRFDTDLTNETNITGFDTTAYSDGSMTSDPATAGKVWINTATTTVKSYTISGTVATSASTVTLSTAASGTKQAIAVKSNGDILVVLDRHSASGNDYFTVKRYNSSGTFQSNITYSPCQNNKPREWVLGFGMIGSNLATAIAYNSENPDLVMRYWMYLIQTDLP